MGFFKNLFEKKICDICGQEIGLLGNRKLEDGNCCKDCAKKLSPWFTERKHSSILEIKQQLADREANRSRVAAFHETRSFGRKMRVLLDENSRQFLVTDARDLQEANPDILSFEQVTACDLDVKESRNEIYRKVRDSEGNTHSESYSPRRYHYSYDFQLCIRLQHPYIDEIEFSLSNGFFRVEALENSSLLSSLLTSNNSLEGSTNPPSMEDRLRNDDYARYTEWAKELQKILLSKNSANISSDKSKVHPYDSEYTHFIRAAMVVQKELQEAEASGDAEQIALSQEELKLDIAVLEDINKKYPDRAALAGVTEALNYWNNHQSIALVQIAPSNNCADAQACATSLRNYIKSEEIYQKAVESGNSNMISFAVSELRGCAELMRNARKWYPEEAEAAGLPEAFKRYCKLEKTLPDEGFPKSVKQPVAPASDICPFCGAKISGGKFCENCGGKLKA